MLTYPDIDPVAVALGPLEVHWYGLMYLVAFAAGWWLGIVRTRRPGTEWRAGEISDLVFYFALGAVLGGRIGYTLMYNFSGFLAEPLVIFRIWQGGMSYHGGMLGVFVAMWLYGRHTGRSFFQVTDFLAPLVPLGLGAGRLGNFINGELWGRPTDLPWGMVFPFVDAQPRHPSMLYEMLLEGLVFSPSCGFSRASRGPPWRCRGCTWCATVCSALWSSSCVCPMHISASLPLTG